MIKKKKKPCKDPNNTEVNKLCFYFSKEFGCIDCTRKYKPKKERVKKRAKAIKKVSKKQQRSNNAVSLAKLRVMQDWIMENGYVYCSSCGTVDGRIDFSHLIPISDNKELEGNPINILPQCGERNDNKEPCHAIQERGDKKMKDFENYDEIMRRIEKLDPEYFRKLIVKHND